MSLIGHAHVSNVEGRQILREVLAHTRLAYSTPSPNSPA